MSTNSKSITRVSGHSVRSADTARSSRVGVKREESESQREMTEVTDAISSNAYDIQPLVYSFRVPRNPSPAPGSIMTAILPPYWLYHDHAFGVIWMLFHEDKRHIGISQLHWCLRFLLDLKNTDGEYTGDVNICIQAVQDNLIEQYAKLGLALERQGEMIKDESARNVGYARERDPNDVSRSENDSKVKRKSSVVQEERVDIKLEDGIDKGNTIPMTTDNANCTMRCSRRALKSEGFPATTLSITYNEMVSRGPAPCAEQIPIEQIFKANIAPGNSISKANDYTAPPKIPLSDTNVEEVVHFLNDARHQHVERIKKEIQRLYQLEKFMESIDARSFSAYITDDLARRLNRLEGQDVVKETEKMIQ